VFKFVERTISVPAAIAAALFFVVYPIDTSRQILMHLVALHGGMFLLLCALHLYMRRRIALSFVIAAASLLNYESFYLPFLAAPLLVARLEKPTGWRLVKHGLLFFGVAITLLLARRFMGESRATELLGGLGDVVTKMLSAGPVGMWVSLKAAVLRPVDALLHAGPLASCLGLAVAAASAVWLARVSRGVSLPTIPAPWGPLAWVAAGGLLAWFISYLLAFRADYYPPIVSIGRLTGVHTTGTLGAAICVAVLAEVLWLQQSHRLRIGVAILFSLLIGFSTTFGLQIQRSEYASHWIRQVAFYQQVITLTADLREGEIVVFDAEGDASVLPITQGFPRFGIVNYTQLAFAKYVSWPATWAAAPQIAVMWEGLPIQPVEGGLALITPPWRYQPPANPTDLPKDVPVARDGRFIYLTAQDGMLRRVSGPVNIRGHVLNARAPLGEKAPTLVASSLFKQLSSGFDPEPWFTLREARNYPR
jgi:hypothetical protein